jgi:hypothetical protein
MFTPLPCTAAHHTPGPSAIEIADGFPLARSAGDPPNLVPSWPKAMPGAARWRGTGWRRTLFSPHSGGLTSQAGSAPTKLLRRCASWAPRMVVRGGCPIGGVCHLPLCLGAVETVGARVHRGRDWPCGRPAIVARTATAHAAMHEEARRRRCLVA